MKKLMNSDSKEDTSIDSCPSLNQIINDVSGDETKYDITRNKRKKRKRRSKERELKRKRNQTYLL